MSAEWRCGDCEWTAPNVKGSTVGFYKAAGHARAVQHEIAGLFDPDQDRIVVEGLDQAVARERGYLPGGRQKSLPSPPSPRRRSGPGSGPPPRSGPAPGPARGSAPDPPPVPDPDPVPEPVPDPSQEPHSREAPLPPEQAPMQVPLEGAGDGEGPAGGEAPGGWSDPFTVSPGGGGGGGGGVLNPPPGGGVPFDPDGGKQPRAPIEGSIPFIRFTPDFICYLAFYCDLEEQPELYRGLSTEEALATYVNACCVSDLMQKAHSASSHKGVVKAIGKSLAFLQQQQAALYIEEMATEIRQMVLTDMLSRGVISADAARQEGLTKPVSVGGA